MKSCSEMRHLEQFGIKPLTGEADALGFRILCDLDEQGVRVFKECFGIPYSATSREIALSQWHGLAENWNSGSIASVMLTGHDVIPLAAIGFYLQGYDVVISDGFVHAIWESDNFKLSEDATHYEINGHCWLSSCWGEVRRVIRQKTSDGRIVQGTRCVHQMTGRVA